MNQYLKINKENEKEAKTYLRDLLLGVIPNDKQLEDGVKNKDKNLDDCWEYIKSEIQKKAKGSRSYGTTDEVVLGIAIHYFTEEIDMSKIKPVKCDTKVVKKEEPKIETPKVETPKVEKKAKPKKQKINEENNFSIWDFISND